MPLGMTAFHTDATDEGLVPEQRKVDDSGWYRKVWAGPRYPNVRASLDLSDDLGALDHTTLLHFLRLPKPVRETQSFL